jgi:hypothetical protein
MLLAGSASLVDRVSVEVLVADSTPAEFWLADDVMAVWFGLGHDVLPILGNGDARARIRA